MSYNPRLMRGNRRYATWALCRIRRSELRLPLRRWRSPSVLVMAVDETVAIPLPNPRLKVRVITLLKAQKPGPFQYLQGMRQRTLHAISADPSCLRI